MNHKYVLPQKIKGHVEWAIEHYHEDKRQLQAWIDEEIPSCVPQYGTTPVKSGISDSTANAAIKLATNPYIKALEQTIRAIDYALSKCDDKDKRLIDLVYWRKSHTVKGAAIKISLSKSGAYNRINRILNLIAYELGYINLQ